MDALPDALLLPCYLFVNVTSLSEQPFIRLLYEQAVRFKNVFKKDIGIDAVMCTLALLQCRAAIAFPPKAVQRESLPVFSYFAKIVIHHIVHREMAKICFLFSGHHPFLYFVGIWYTPIMLLPSGEMQHIF